MMKAVHHNDHLLQPNVNRYPFRVRPHYQYAAPIDTPLLLQDFQFFVVIDFEATCDKDRIPNPQEIIEFPSVLVSGLTGEIKASFQTYVRPTSNQLLTDFCKDLTGIQQTQVDGGISLSEALVRHDQWLQSNGVFNTNFAVVTWTDWDCKVMLESECRYKKIAKPHYFNQWINLKVPFREVFGGTRFNLKEAVEKAGLSWEGRAHCGLDDAKNTARLLSRLMDKGFKFSITNSLPSNGGLVPFSPPRILQVLPLQYHPCCQCGMLCVLRINVREQGTKQHLGFFFECGNWRGSLCRYFEWASNLVFLPGSNIICDAMPPRFDKI